MLRGLLRLLTAGRVATTGGRSAARKSCHTLALPCGPTSITAATPPTSSYAPAKRPPPCFSRFRLLSCLSVDTPRPRGEAGKRPSVRRAPGGRLSVVFPDGSTVEVPWLKPQWTPLLGSSVVCAFRHLHGVLRRVQTRNPGGNRLVSR